MHLAGAVARLFRGEGLDENEAEFKAQRNSQQ